MNYPCALQLSNQLNQRELVKFRQVGGGLGVKRAVLSCMSTALTCDTFVLTCTVMAKGLYLPEGRTEGGYQTRTETTEC